MTWPLAVAASRRPHSADRPMPVDDVWTVATSTSDDCRYLDTTRILALRTRRSHARGARRPSFPAPSRPRSGPKEGGGAGLGRQVQRRRLERKLRPFGPSRSGQGRRWDHAGGRDGASTHLSDSEVVIDGPGLREVLVKTAASGICHSDLHVIEGGLPVPPPCILGHEPAGIVEKVGAGVTDFVPGDHVIGCITAVVRRLQVLHAGPALSLPDAVRGRPPSAKPRLTRQGRQPDLLQFANLSSFAEKMLCPERSLVKIRDDMPLDRACADRLRRHHRPRRRAQHRAHPGRRERRSIVGCGGVGLAALQGARIVGAGKIIAVDTQPLEVRARAQARRDRLREREGRRSGRRGARAHAAAAPTSCSSASASCRPVQQVDRDDGTRRHDRAGRRRADHRRWCRSRRPT